MTVTSSLSDVEQLKPCPFCGATPHRGQTKHGTGQDGELLQGYRIWCPHHCAQTQQPAETFAITAWNRRSNPIPDSGERVRALGKKLQAAYDLVKEWPENRMSEGAVESLGEGFVDLIRLRNLVPKAIEALSSLNPAPASVEVTGEAVASMLAEIEVLLDNCHVVEDIDIAAQHEAVKKLVRQIAAAPASPTAVQITDAMVERFNEQWAKERGLPLDTFTPDERARWNASVHTALTAALEHRGA